MNEHTLTGHLLAISSGAPSRDRRIAARLLAKALGFEILCTNIPELMIVAERRLCEEVHLNLAYRWFFRLGLEGVVPDHSTFSKNRHGRFRDSVVAPIVRSDCATLHGLGSGRRRRLCGGMPA
jgi:hypothetical protein